jgi:hypothetical protein
MLTAEATTSGEDRRCRPGPLAPAEMRGHRGGGQNALDARAHRAGARHLEPRRA